MIESIAQYAENEINKARGSLVNKGFEIECDLTFGSVVSGNIKDPSKNLGLKSDIDLLVIARDENWPLQWAYNGPRYIEHADGQSNLDFKRFVFGGAISGYSYIEKSEYFPETMPLLRVESMVYSVSRAVYELQALQKMLTYSGEVDVELKDLFIRNYFTLYQALTASVLNQGEIPKQIQLELQLTQEAYENYVR